MTDHELRTMLAERTEPPFTLDPEVTIRRGRRRGRIRAGIATAAVVGVVGTAGSFVLTGERAADRTSARDTSVATAPKVATPPPAPQPATPLGDYLTELSTTTFGASVPDLGPARLSVIAPPERLVEQDDPAAQAFNVTYRAADRMLRAGRSGRPLDQLGLACDSTGVYATCVHESGADGGQVRMTTGAVSEPTADGYFRMYPPKQRGEHSGELFWRRTVSRTTADGHLNVAEEFVRADTEAEAEAAWVVPVDALRSLVADPGLAAYSLPHLSWY